MPFIRRSIDGIEVKPGARIHVRGGEDVLRFTLFTVCTAVDPEGWVGEVSMAGTVVLRTRTYDTQELAAAETRKALQAKVVDIFSS